MPYCTKCGKQVGDDDFFCPKCGTRTRHGVEAKVPITFPSEEMKATFRKMAAESDKMKAASEMKVAFWKMADEMQKAMSEALDEVQRSDATKEARETLLRVGKELQTTLSNAAKEAASQKVGEAVEKALSGAAKQVEEAFRVAKENVATRVSQGTVHCQKCGKGNDSDAKFCYNCGKKLS